MPPAPPSPTSSGTSQAALGDVETNQTLEAFLRALAVDDPDELYDKAPCGYLTTTPDGLLTKVNETFLALTGYRRVDLVGERFLVDLLTAGGRIYHETHYAPLLQMHGTAREIALDLVCADGRRLPVLVNSVLERDAAGQPTVIRTAVFDATQRREYERELLRAKQRAEESEARARTLARTLQQTFIPPAHPHIGGLEVEARYRPAGDGTEIGGDFYDVFEVGPNDWCIVIGDVCGKGVDAAVVATLARHTVRAASVRQPSPSGALGTLNDVLSHHESDRFCTLDVIRLRLDGGRWTATVACGGHPLPVLVRPGEAPAAFGTMGCLVGAIEPARVSDATLELEPGDAIVLYTDGITEARSPSGEIYGEDRLYRLMAALSSPAAMAATIADALLESAMAFQARTPRDDIALVVVRVPSELPGHSGGSL
jgi:sigma-B regulation protein RsbU (phosphoserine phosphatase)